MSQDAIKVADNKFFNANQTLVEKWTRVLGNDNVLQMKTAVHKHLSSPNTLIRKFDDNTYVSMETFVLDTYHINFHAFDGDLGICAATHFQRILRSLLTDVFTEHGYLLKQVDIKLQYRMFDSIRPLDGTTIALLALTVVGIGGLIFEAMLFRSIKKARQCPEARISVSFVYSPINGLSR